MAFSEYLSDCFVTHVKIFCEREVQFHSRHLAVHMCCCLPDALITLLGGFSHDCCDLGCLPREWSDNGPMLGRSWAENGPMKSRKIMLVNSVGSVKTGKETKMSQEAQIQLFENAKIRVVWDDEQEKYFFSVVDVIAVLTESSMAKRYWTDLKRRLKAEGADETYAKIVRLKMSAPDGKMRETDAADLEQILRIVQSIPSKKAEPLKRWLAQVGSERIQQMIDPELAIQQAVADYKKQGYSDKWIANRVK